MLLVSYVVSISKFITNSINVQKYKMTWVKWQFHLSLKENVLENILKGYQLPKLKIISYKI